MSSANAINRIAGEEARQHRKRRLRWWILAVLSVSLLIIIIDDSIINVAIPTLQRELGASAAALQWIVDAYIVVFAGPLLAMGALGDRFGRRRFLQLGLLVFGASSLYAAYAGSAAELVVARAAMGVGGALIMPSTLSVLIDVFPRQERVKAIGIWTGIASVGIPLGPIVGGWLLEQYWWGSVFLLNVPIVAVALVAGWFLVPESRHPSPPRPDLLGMALSTVSLGALVYAVIEAPASGWSSAKVIGGLIAAIVAGAGFVRHERRTWDRGREPMLDLRLFANPRLGWGTVAITLAGFALAGLVFDLTQFLQFVQGYTPLQAGFRILPIAVGFGVAGPVSQRLVAKAGTGRTAAAGLAALAVPLAVLSLVEPTTTYWLVGFALLVAGVGVGAAFVPSTDAVMAAVPETNAGLGSALNDTSRQLGAALGVGVLGSLTYAAYAARIGGTFARLGPDATAVAKQSVAAALQLADRGAAGAGEGLRRTAMVAFTDGFSLAMLVAAGLMTLGAILVWRLLPARDVQHPLAGPHNPDRGPAGDDRPAEIADVGRHDRGIRR